MEMCHSAALLAGKPLLGRQTALWINSSPKWGSRNGNPLREHADWLFSNEVSPLRVLCGVSTMNPVPAGLGLGAAVVSNSCMCKKAEKMLLLSLSSFLVLFLGWPF